MKIKVSTYKFIDKLGEKRVHIEVEEAGRYTTKIFRDKTEFKLREVENGVLKGVWGYDPYTSYTEVRVKDDKEIDELVNQVIDLYKMINQKEWCGTKNYIVEI